MQENGGHVRAVTKATLITIENGESPSTALRDKFWQTGFKRFKNVWIMRNFMS